MTREQRQQVYDKYEGRCAYTGKPLGEDWQVDHITSKIRHWYNTVQATPHTGTIEEYKREFNKRLKDCDNTDNLVPALRIVNHYKRSLDLEGFRSRMMDFHKRLSRLPKNPVSERSIRRKEYMYQVADAFGITPEKPFTGKFYFETI